MKIIPAVDIKNGKCVRLSQGKADQETIYSDHPKEMADHWDEEQGRKLYKPGPEPHIYAAHGTQS